MVSCSVTVKSYFEIEMGSKIKDFLIRLDVWINVHIFNGQNETISDRLGEHLLIKDYGCCRWRVCLCKILSWLDPRPGNHCIEAIEEID